MQSAEESAFAERGYLASVINVRSLQMKKNAVLQKKTKTRISQVIMSLLGGGLLGEVAEANKAWRLGLVVFDWLRRTLKGSLPPDAQHFLLALSTFSPYTIQ